MEIHNHSYSEGIWHIKGEVGQNYILDLVQEDKANIIADIENQELLAVLYSKLLHLLK